MGRHRKDPNEVKKTVCINLKQSIISEIEKEGKVKHVIEALVNQKYNEKIAEN